MRLGFVTKDFDEIDKTQFVQKQKGDVEIRIVCSKTLSEEVKDKVKKNLEDRCGKGNMDIVVRQVDDNEIIYSSLLKFKYVYSEIGRGSNIS